MKQAKWVDTGTWKKDEAKTVNEKDIEKLKKALEDAGIKIDEFKKPNRTSPQPSLPKIWTLPPARPRGYELDDEFEKDLAERELVAFMQECRERTADMKDSEKCERCKLRFRCYTEIKVEKKRKTSTKKITRSVRPMVFKNQTVQVVLDELDTKSWEKKVDGIFNSYTEPNSKTKG